MEKLNTHCRNSLGKLKLFFKTQTHFETGNYNEKKKNRVGDREEVQLLECLPLMQEALGLIPTPHNPVSEVHTYNVSTKEVEAGGSEGQGRSWLK